MSTSSPIIMVVEDENLLLQAISKKLKTMGLEAITCSSGEQALDYVRNLSEFSDLPDAIWLDYHLTDMDGLEVLSELKSDKNTKDIPVIVVSNSASEEKVSNMLALGADKYLLKAEHRLDEIISTLIEFVKETREKK